MHRGSLDDLDSLKRGAADTEGVIHCGFIHDFTQYAAAAQTDQQAIAAMGAVLASTNRPFIVTSGFANLTQTGSLITEDDTLDPNVSAMRLSEGAALELATQGARAMVMRLAASVHGENDHGFVPALIGIAREKGVAAYVGDGQNRWPAVHRLDAARLYRLALEHGVAGARYHAVADEGIALRDLAAVIGRHLNVPVVSKSQEEAAGHFNWMAGFVGLDLAASSALTQERLKWHPTHTALLPELEQGDYFKG